MLQIIFDVVYLKHHNLLFAKPLVPTETSNKYAFYGYTRNVPVGGLNTYGWKSKISTGWTKKRGISKTMAITPLKSIRKGKNWCVSENSALMLQDRHQTVQN